MTTGNCRHRFLQDEVEAANEAKEKAEKDVEQIRTQYKSLENSFDELMQACSAFADRTARKIWVFAGLQSHAHILRICCEATLVMLLARYGVGWHFVAALSMRAVQYGSSFALPVWWFLQKRTLLHFLAMPASGTLYTGLLASSPNNQPDVLNKRKMVKITNSCRRM